MLLKYVDMRQHRQAAGALFLQLEGRTEIGIAQEGGVLSPVAV